MRCSRRFCKARPVPGWYMFDPTRMAAPEGVVRIGIGRDAAEVAFCTQFGEMEFDKPEVSINGPDRCAARDDAGGARPGRIRR